LRPIIAEPTVSGGQPPLLVLEIVGRKGEGAIVGFGISYKRASYFERQVYPLVQVER
jgi:hypothetical protein